MKHYKIKLGEKEKHVYVDSIESKTKNIETGVTNHIHILDRSGSMSSHISSLIEDVKKTLTMIDKEDYVTILWFSGAGEFRTVLKNAKNSDPSIIKILDTLKSTVGSTCFSDPLVELNKIIEESKAICDTFNVTIFTDGDTVTPWSASEERQRIIKALSNIKDKVIAFNAIGYGYYYNKELLKEMAEFSEYGVVTHASNIEDYANIFNHNKEVVESLKGERVTIDPNGVCEIVFLGDKTTKLYESKGTTRVNGGRNLYAIITDNDYGTPILEEPCQNTIDLLYAYAYNLYYNGKIKDSAKVINFLGNKKLLEEQTNAFTVTEQANYQKELLEMVIKGKNKFNKILSNTLTPKRDAYCILDLLEDLVSSGAKYIPTSNYKRISKKTNDDFNLFESDKNEDGYPMNDIVLSQDRLNISLRFRVEGNIRLNPLEAKKVGLESKVKSFIYRTHTFIQDGNLNMEQIEFTCESLPEKLKNVVETIGDNYYRVDLRKLPVINATYIDEVSAVSILNLELEMLKLEAQNKVINSKLKETKKEFSESQTAVYTEEQLEVLKNHGLSFDGSYRPIATSVVEPTDFYVVKEFSTYIKGSSSLPTIAKVEEKVSSGKALNLVESLMSQAIKYISVVEEEDLKQQLILNKKVLNKIRFKLSGFKIALVLTNEWLNETTKQEDGSFTFTKDDKTLIIKLTRKEIGV